MRTVNAAEASLGPWQLRAQKAIRRWAPSPSVSVARAADPGAANVLAPQAARSDSPEAQVWFGAWVKDAAFAGAGQPPGTPGTASPDPGSRLAGGADAPGDMGAFAPALASKRSADAAAAGAGTVAPSPRIPGWTDILDELMPRASSGAQASRSKIADSAQAFDSIPTGTRGPKDRAGIPNGITSKLRTADDTSRSVSSLTAETPLPKGAPSVEWLDEEDDLAGKLHRLLRRQAKRRGVDLS